MSFARYSVCFALQLSLFVSSEISLSQYRFKRQSDECTELQFNCTNKECIASEDICDGYKNCKDGSDETLALCSTLLSQCPSFSFRCAYGACVDAKKKCDGIMDCADNSDELLPECKIVPSSGSHTCKEGEFQCTSGQCITDDLLCDGDADCTDGSDETIAECINFKCPKFSFQCQYGACIDCNKVCNGVKDCSADGSDEHPASCDRCKGRKQPPVRTTAPPKTTQIRPPTSRPVKNGCALPAMPTGGNYIVESCEDNEMSDKCLRVEGTPVGPSTVLSYSCSQGYFLPPENQFSICFNNTWSRPFSSCLKKCAALKSTSMDFECVLKGDPISCENDLPPGTFAEVRCKLSHRIKDPASAFIRTQCLPTGRWETPIYECVPKCGMANLNIEKPLISFGSQASVGEAPWHAAIYLCESPGSCSQVCGGTIISANDILTAAHCVYLESSKKSREPNKLKVAVGKFNRAYNTHDQYEQKRDVSQVIILNTYQGSITNNAQDIAILHLVSNIIFSTVVMPACIYWENEWNYPSGTLGTVVGWGVTEEQVSSEVLLMAKLPVLHYEDCLKQVDKMFERYITYDKICAGYFNGTGVQEGDSGGGLTLPDPHSGLHYLYGVVSLKRRNVNSLGAFTDIYAHKAWLRKTLNATEFISL